MESKHVTMPVIGLSPDCQMSQVIIATWQIEGQSVQTLSVFRIDISSDSSFYLLV